VLAAAANRRVRQGERLRRASSSPVRTWRPPRTRRGRRRRLRTRSPSHLQQGPVSVDVTTKMQRLRPLALAPKGVKLERHVRDCATCSKVRHQYCGNFEGTFISHCAKISAAVGQGRCVKDSVTLLGYTLSPASSATFGPSTGTVSLVSSCTQGEYILACWIPCVDLVFWFVWSAVASRHNRAIGMTACERTGSASFTVKEPGREEQPDGGSYWSPEFCVSEYVPDAAGVAGVTHGGFLVST
jgi:hypothetical protein